MASSSCSYLWPALRSTQRTKLCVRYAHACRPRQLSSAISCCHCVLEHNHPQTFHFVKSNAGHDRQLHGMRADEALWTFDTTALTWQQRHPSGPLPSPRRAVGLAVVEDHAYVLVNQRIIGGSLEVYELDLGVASPARQRQRSSSPLQDQSCCRSGASLLAIQSGGLHLLLSSPLLANRM